MYKRVLMADDGSEPGAAALQEAIKIAGASGGELRIVYVTQRPVSYGYAIVNLEAVKQSLRDEGQQILDRAAARAREAGVNVATQLIEADDVPIARALAHNAQTWGADLIVMGTHGRRGLDHFMLGSVAEAVLRVATTPVLMVRVAGRS
jgi:nucleotide-binding universal stress UspA family protein